MDEFHLKRMYPGAGFLRMAFTPTGGGEPVIRKIFEFPAGGVAMGMYNRDESIKGFAQSCFNFAQRRSTNSSSDRSQSLTRASIAPMRHADRINSPLTAVWTAIVATHKKPRQTMTQSRRGLGRFPQIYAKPNERNDLVVLRNKATGELRYRKIRWSWPCWFFHRSLEYRYSFISYM
jgi:hypothetical protein